MKKAAIILLILNSLPLFIYPFVFIASVMGLAAAGGGGGGGGGPQATLLFTLFLWTSLAYPLPWLAALIGSVACLVRGRFKWALWQQLAVSGFLAGVFALFVITVMTEG